MHGLPMSLYTDRGSHYFHTPKPAARSTGPIRPRSAGRLAQLGVEHIGAYSPQARGRSERAFGTLQDRLVNELGARRDHDDRGGRRLHSRRLSSRLQRALRGPAGRREGSAFTPIPGVDLDEILCVQEERQVGNDNCVSFRTLKLQIPESPMRPHFVKARVKVARLPRRIARRFPRAQMHRPLRRKGRPADPAKRRLNPLGGEPVDGMDKPRLAHPPTGEQKQKKRTYDALPKPDNLIRYRQRGRRRRKPGEWEETTCSMCRCDPPIGW